LNANKKSLDIVLAGVGGQGVVLASTIIGEAAVEEGFEVRIAENHGLAQRGGTVTSHIRIGDEIYSPLIPEGHADIVVGFEPLESLRHAIFLKPRCGCAVVNTQSIPSIPARLGLEKYPLTSSLIQTLRKITKFVYPFDAHRTAIKAGSVKTLNTVMIGALAAAAKLPFSLKSIEEAIKRSVPLGTEKLNLEAFKRGLESIRSLEPPNLRNRVLMPHIRAKISPA
jgi:indolepyruvate ferredoxin oxidoreductase beta subunit